MAKNLLSFTSNLFTLWAIHELSLLSRLLKKSPLAYKSDYVKKRQRMLKKSTPSSERSKESYFFKFYIHWDCLQKSTSSFLNEVKNLLFLPLLKDEILWLTASGW